MAATTETRHPDGALELEYETRAVDARVATRVPRRHAPLEQCVLLAHGAQGSGYAMSRSRCASDSDESFLSAWFSI